MAGRTVFFNFWSDGTDHNVNKMVRNIYMGVWAERFYVRWVVNFIIYMDGDYRFILYIIAWLNFHRPDYWRKNAFICLKTRFFVPKLLNNLGCLMRSNTHLCKVALLSQLTHCHLTIMSATTEIKKITHIYIALFFGLT